LPDKAHGTDSPFLSLLAQVRDSTRRWRLRTPSFSSLPPRPPRKTSSSPSKRLSELSPKESTLSIQ